MTAADNIGNNNFVCAVLVVSSIHFHGLAFMVTGLQSLLGMISVIGLTCEDVLTALVLVGAPQATRWPQAP